MPGATASTVADILSPEPVPLDLHLAGVQHRVRIGEDAVPFDDHTRGADVGRGLLAPRSVRIRQTQRGKHLHHRIAQIGGNGPRRHPPHPRHG